MEEQVMLMEVAEEVHMAEVSPGPTLIVICGGVEHVLCLIVSE